MFFGGISGYQGKEAQLENAPCNKQIVDIRGGTYHKELGDFGEQSEINRLKDCSAPGMPIQRAERFERGEGFAHSRPADPEIRGKLALGRELVAGLQLAADDIAAQAPQDLTAEWLFLYRFHNAKRRFPNSGTWSNQVLVLV